MTIPSVPISATEFQLVLLRRMADFQPELVENARKSLGFDVTEMRAVNATWQRMLHSRNTRGPLNQIRSVLGKPIGVVEHKIGDTLCRGEQWELPLWPDLRFEAFIGPGDMLLKEHLVRTPGVPRPTLKTLDDLTPWSCVLSDVAVAFGRLKQLEGSAPTRDLALTMVDGGRGEKIAVATEFVYGLLQVARPYEQVL